MLYALASLVHTTIMEGVAAPPPVSTPGGALSALNLSAETMTALETMEDGPKAEVMKMLETLALGKQASGESALSPELGTPGLPTAPKVKPLDLNGVCSSAAEFVWQFTLPTL